MPSSLCRGGVDQPALRCQQHFATTAEHLGCAEWFNFRDLRRLPRLGVEPKQPLSSWSPLPIFNSNECRGTRGICKPQDPVRPGITPDLGSGPRIEAADDRRSVVLGPGVPAAGFADAHAIYPESGVMNCKPGWLDRCKARSSAARSSILPGGRLLTSSTDS